MRLVAAGEVDQVVHQQRQLLDLLDDVAEQPLALVGVHVLALLLQDLDVRAQAGDRRAQLVRGVGDELALRVHGVVERAHGVLERVEHRVEAAGEPPELVFAGGLDAPAEVARDGDVLGGVGEALERLYGGAGDEPPEQRGERDAADDEQREDQAQAAEQAVDFGQRLGELHDVPLAERLGEHAQVDAVDGGVAQERLAAVGGERARAGVDRQRDARGGAFDDRALGVDDLLVAAHLVGAGGEAAEEVAGVRAGEQARAPAERGAAEAFGLDLPHEAAARAGAMAQLAVDLAVELVGGEHVGEDRREHDGDRDGGGRDDRDAPAEAHGALRST